MCVVAHRLAFKLSDQVLFLLLVQLHDRVTTALLFLHLKRVLLMMMWRDNVGQSPRATRPSTDLLRDWLHLVEELFIAKLCTVLISDKRIFFIVIGVFAVGGDAGIRWTLSPCSLSSSELMLAIVCV